jgi:hypothetical protein
MGKRADGLLLLKNRGECESYRLKEGKGLPLERFCS